MKLGTNDLNLEGMTNKGDMKQKKVYFSEFHKLFKGNIVEVCEGEGIKEDPYRLVYYVHDEQGNFLGRLDTLQQEGKG